MESLLRHQVYKLDMEALCYRLHLEDRVIVVVNELWDTACTKLPPRLVGISWGKDGMKVVLDEIMVPIFCFANKAKFWRQTL